jgi:hypothetical protein
MYHYDIWFFYQELHISLQNMFGNFFSFYSEFGTERVNYVNNVSKFFQNNILQKAQPKIKNADNNYRKEGVKLKYLKV